MTLPAVLTSHEGPNSLDTLEKGRNILCNISQN